MRRTILLLSGVLLWVGALGSDSPKDYDDAAVPVGMQGTWRLVEYSFNGQTMKMVPEMLIDRGGTFISNYGNGETYQGSYRLDPARKPSHLDRMPSNGFYQGHTMKCLYQLDRDTLRIAFLAGGPDMPRPQGFNDNGVVIWTYKRVK